MQQRDYRNQVTRRDYYLTMMPHNTAHPRQPLKCHSTQSDNKLGLENANLLVKNGSASFEFLTCWRTIARRKTTQNIAYIER